MGQATRAVAPALFSREITSHALIGAACGIDLASFREEHVRECVRRSLEREGLGSERVLAARVAADPGSRMRFRRSLAVSVTGMFRDPGQFAVIERVVLPELRAAGQPLRVWSAGCANGAELYSVAAMLERLGLLDRAELLGSDLLRENIAAAHEGVYDGERMPDHIRTRLRWEVRDLVDGGSPAGEWSLVLCRNVAIYLNRGAKHDLLELLAGALAPGGFLLLGRSESVIDPARLGLTRCAPHTYRRTS